MTMDTSARESYILSNILDRIGYSRRIVNFRQCTIRNIEKDMNDKFRELQLNVIFAGSKGEGLTAPCESDSDIMHVPFNVFCSQNPAVINNRDDTTVFELDMKHAAPGYTFIRAVQFSETPVVSYLIEGSLVKCLSGQMYLSSDFWKQEYKLAFTEEISMSGNQGFMSMQRDHGPAVTATAHGMSVDNVFAITCDCPRYLNAWVNRERLYQWPSVNVIRDVSNLEPHVVPVGCADSSTYFLEWRICFTKGEIRLVQSLNDCLTKVLVLLKQIAKETLKPLCKDMTTYIMKNIVFWIAESHDFYIFKENNLLSMLQLALKSLKKCVVAKSLPNYMIPERNLLANRLTNKQRVKVCLRIDSLLCEGPRMVLRCKKLMNAFSMFSHCPHEFRDFFRRRQLVELFELAQSCYFVQNLWTPGMTTEQSMQTALQDDVCKYFAFKKGSVIYDDITEEDLDLDVEDIEELINIARVEGLWDVETMPYLRMLC